MTTASAPERRALVTGATGFVGHHVVLALVENGWKVRALCRSRDKALTMAWADLDAVEIFEGDASNRSDVESALAGIDCAWYLLHSMSSGTGFADKEAAMARQFGEAAAANGVARIVYLGGLHPEGEKISEHLESRVKVGKELHAAGVPVAALQAGVVIGKGSLSFKLLRHVSERVPTFVAPGWITNRVTPISVRDVVHYLVAAADLPEDVSRAFDVGGPESMPYVDMMQRYTQVVGVKWRPFFAAPIMTRKLAARGLAIITPLSLQEILPIFDSVASNTVLKERDLEELVGTPEGGNQSFEEAVARAAEGTQPGRYGRIATTVHLAVLATAVVGSILTDPDSTRYRRLKKPTWQPPALAFPIVWSLLYLDLAVISTTTIADSVEEDEPQQARGDALAVGANLVLNAGWCGVFFRSNKHRLSTLWAAVLAASSADLVRRAYRHSPMRGLVLAPYAVWTAFATVLTGRIAQLNR